MEASGTLTPLALLLLRFKYHAERGAGYAIYDFVRRYPPPPIFASATVAPVPMPAARLSARTVNPAAWLGRALARAGGWAWRPFALARTGSSPPQAGRPAHARRKLRHAFVADRGIVRRAPVILVDDVCTTGATLTDAVRAVDEAGGIVIASCVLLAVTPQSRPRP